MKKLVRTLLAALALAVLVPSVAHAEEKVLGVVTRIDVAPTGAVATAILKDSKSGALVDITVQDTLTLDKFKDHRIGVGDEIKCRYDKKEGKNVATFFKKAGGC